MLRDIYLHGGLAERYGPHFRWDVDTVAECVSAFQANFGDFFPFIKDGRYQIVRGQWSQTPKDTPVNVNGRGQVYTLDTPVKSVDLTPDYPDYLSEKQLHMLLGRATEMHIIPVVEGSGSGGNKGIMTAVLGLAMIAAAVVTAGAAVGGLPGLVPAMGTIGAELPILGCVTLAKVATFGAILALGGISQLLTQPPKSDYNSRDKEKASFLFSGAVNRQEQGVPIPVIYGQVRVGSIVVSSGIDIEEKNTNEETGPKVTVWVKCGVGGTITVGAGANSIAYNGSISIEWAEDAGWDVYSILVSNYSGDGATIEYLSPSTPYTLTNIVYDTTLHVLFAETV